MEGKLFPYHNDVFTKGNKNFLWLCNTYFCGYLENYFFKKRASKFLYEQSRARKIDLWFFVNILENCEIYTHHNLQSNVQLGGEP